MILPDRRAEITGIIGVIAYGLGTVIGIFLIGVVVFWLIQDVTHRKHTVLRNYPVIGRRRFFLDDIDEYFRRYTYPAPVAA